MADMTSVYAQLEQASRRASPQLQPQFTPQIESFLILARRIADFADSIETPFHFFDPDPDVKRVLNAVHN